MDKNLDISSVTIKRTLTQHVKDCYIHQIGADIRNIFSLICVKTNTIVLLLE